MLDHTIGRETCSGCHLAHIVAAPALGMDLEGTGTTGCKPERMAENIIRCRQEFRTHVIVGPAALESHRLSFLHVCGRFIKAGELLGKKVPVTSLFHDSLPRSM